MSQDGVVSLLTPGGLELQHEVGGGDELGLDPGLCGGVSDGNRQMSLADAGGTKQHGVLTAFDEPQRRQFVDQLGVLGIFPSKKT